MSDFTVQELTLGQLLENTAARFPDTDAVIHADRELRQTWSEFSACVDDMARGLMAIGVQKGEKVAVWATNVPHWVTLMFATARIGAILVTVNTNYRETSSSSTACATTILLLPHMRCSPNCAASGAGCSKSRGCRT